jgi:hypothetical protein
MDQNERGGQPAADQFLDHAAELGQAQAASKPSRTVTLASTATTR